MHTLLSFETGKADLFSSLVAMHISGFLNMEKLGVFLLTSGCDTSPRNSCLSAFNYNLVPIYTWLKRATARE